MVRALRSSVDRIDIVGLPQGFQIAVPRWMLDPVVCSQLRQEAKPRLALSALGRLVDLVRRGRLPMAPATAASGSSTPAHGHHASRQEASLLSSAVTPPQEVDLGTVSGIETTALSPPAGSNASGGHPRNLAGKERS